MEPSSLLRVAILLGGNSAERETSLDSGRNVAYKLSAKIYRPIPIFVTESMELYTLTPAQLVNNATHEIVSSLQPEQKIGWSELPLLADFVFIALHGGKGENGAVQGMLEMLNMPYNGSSVLASALCMNKYAANQFLVTQGFEVPQAFLLKKTDWEKIKGTIDSSELKREEKTNKQAEMLEKMLTHLSFPLIVKPYDDGCSFMVSKITDKQSLIIAVDRIFNFNKDAVLIEEFMQGMELTIGVIGNEKAYALPPSQALANGSVLTIEEKFLPGFGENQTPALLPSSVLAFIQRTMEKIYETLTCRGYARIDCFYQHPEQSPTGKQRIVIIEINTLPGLTPATCLFHQAAEIGLKPADFLSLLIELGRQEHLVQEKKVALRPEFATIIDNGHPLYPR